MFKITCLLLRHDSVNDLFHHKIRFDISDALSYEFEILTGSLQPDSLEIIAKAPTPVTDDLCKYTACIIDMCKSNGSKYIVNNPIYTQGNK